MNLAALSVQPDRLRKIRVLVIGDSGSGKTSLVHLLVNGEPLRQPRRTIGCSVSVKLVEYPEYNDKGELVKTQPHFVELWDIGTHNQYAAMRGIFYSQINGIILVHDLSSRRSGLNLHRWASEVAARGTFSAPFADVDSCSERLSGVAGLYGLPVPAVVIGNKLDAAARLSPGGGHFVNTLGRHLLGLLGRCVWGARGRWAALDRARMHLFGRRRDADLAPALLPDSDPGGGGVRTSALRGVVDSAPLERFFHLLITRRYYPQHGSHPSAPNLTPPAAAAQGDGASMFSTMGARNGSAGSNLGDLTSGGDRKKDTVVHHRYGSGSGEGGFLDIMDKDPSRMGPTHLPFELVIDS